MSYQEYQSVILQTARDSIRHGLEHNKALKCDHSKVPAALLVHGACFVTLEINHQLRGCIGSLQAYQPLIDDIADNACAAAFSDPRFPAVNEHDLQRLDIHVSILNPAEEMQFNSQDDLIEQIRPGIDGLILEDAGKRGTFLPSVWESLPDARDFLNHLKMKAGLSKDYWSDTIKVSRYTTEMIE